MFAAMTVNAWSVHTSDGVPSILPVLLSKLKPSGRSPERISVMGSVPLVILTAALYFFP